MLPLLLGPLGVEAVSAHGFSADAQRAAARALREAVGQAKRLVSAIGADLGVVFDRAGERIFLIDEQAREIPVEQALLLFLRLMGSDGRHGKLAFPITVTSHVDELVEGSGLEVIRTPASLAELTKAAAERRRHLRGRRRRRLRLPGVPAGLRRGGEPLQAARAAGAGRASRSRSSSPSCRRARSSTARCRAPGR